jgi:glycosyl hydrolase family 79
VGKIHRTAVGLQACLLLTSLIAPSCQEVRADELSIRPESMVRIGTVDERFQSYNVEMVEVTGGRFWKPYGPNASDAGSDLFAYRAPVDLANSRLRKLAAALAPAYMRVSGTWANTTYFADSDIVPSAPPDGFSGILTRQQWLGVVDFARAVGAQIVTSLAISPGTRDAAGVWVPDQARRFLTYTRSIGGSIAAAEFMNEPNLAEMGGAPAGYDAAGHGRDFKVFHSFVQESFPEIKVLGPGAAGATASALDLLVASGTGGIDAFSYHHYGTLSERCRGTSEPEAALSEDWLSRTDQTFAFYRLLRDKFDPGKPIWLTETAEAACGGNRWAATFLDTFRYLDQLGRLARAGVQVVMHNTLAASDYGLLDEKTLAPRPNYWGALLWRQLMGITVLDSGVPIQTGLHVYAHCQRGTPGGVSLLIINTDRNAPHSLTLPTASLRYTLEAASLRDGDVRLNGHPLALDPGDELPPIAGAPTTANTLTFKPATITFLAIPAAGNNTCL